MHTTAKLPCSVWNISADSFFSSWQKIDTFNKEIISTIEGEEFVEQYDSRLFTKVRAEFSKWSAVVEKNFEKGESEAPR